MADVEADVATGQPKMRTFRKFSFRGVDLDALLDMSTDELVKLFPARAHRRFQRGLKRKSMADEMASIDGISGRFGSSLPKQSSEALKRPVVATNPFNCCANSSLKLLNSIALAKRGDCTFTDKAKVAQAGGASGLILINDNEELYKMNFLATGGKVDIQLYSPDRPAVDLSEIFLWLMAVGTVVCASLWDEYIAFEQDQANAGVNSRGDSEKEILEINAKGAIIFVITVSAFLMLLYFYVRLVCLGADCFVLYRCY